jgi:transposase
MRPHGTGAELERRRRLAVARVRSGHTQTDVANFLGVHPNSVWRWMEAYREKGMAGLRAHNPTGRPPKLSAAQEREVLRWFRRLPSEFGFPTELWTAPRVAKLMAKHFHVRFHPRYVCQWLAQRRITPQKPALRSYKRNDREVRHWLREEWPRIKKVRGVDVPTSS